jgi:hypothetical protein
MSHTHNPFKRKGYMFRCLIVEIHDKALKDIQLQNPSYLYLDIGKVL